MTRKTAKYIFYIIFCCVLGLAALLIGITRDHSGKTLEVTDANFAEALKGQQPVLVDFFATWCGPCQRQGPIVDELAEENPQYIIGKLDVDQNPEKASQYHIKTVPTLIIFKNGQEVERFVGSQSKETLKARLAAHNQ